MQYNEPQVVSLFTGAMGLDVGIGMDTVLCAEADEACRRTISANLPTAKVVDDVRLVNASIAPMRPFLVIGGPPCPAFSTMGHRLSFADPRGMLAFEFGRVVRELQPRFFVMENVKGMLSSKVPWNVGSNAADEVLSNFRAIGYKVVSGVMLAADYGVPQFRERFVVIGSRDAEDVFMPRPTHFQRHQSSRHRWQTLRDSIWPLREFPGDCARFTPDRLALLKMVPSGGNWNDLPADLKAAAMGGAFKSGGGKTGFYRRLSWDEPSPTLVTSPTQKSTMLCHPEMDRPLSVAEYAAIQQFDPGWRFEGSLADKYRQIGNAVPCGMGRAIGEAIYSVAMGDSEVRTKRFK